MIIAESTGGCLLPGGRTGNMNDSSQLTPASETKGPLKKRTFSSKFVLVS